jgi:hypothetical protein
VLVYLRECPEQKRWQLATRAREHVLAHHTAAHRAVALEEYVDELFGTASRRLAAAG